MKNAPRQEKRTTVKELTDLVSPPLAEVAEALGTTHGSLLTWRSQDRRSSAMVRERLASYMRERAKLLQAAADELERGQ